MSIIRKYLPMWAANPTEPDGFMEPLDPSSVSIDIRPEPADVCFEPPAADESRKACSNCTFWVVSKQCVLHEPALFIEGDRICNRHIQGEPASVYTNRPCIEHLDPMLSGLEQVPGGRSCDVCRFYAEISMLEGNCMVVMDPETRGPLLVQRRACCARWEIC